MKRTKSNFPELIIILICAGLVIAGWVMNLAKAWSIFHEPMGFELATRVIGAVLMPLGVLMGYV